MILGIYLFLKTRLNYIEYYIFDLNTFDEDANKLHDELMGFKNE
jgi:hypothetical protein